jgi:hypothetical protein
MRLLLTLFICLLATPFAFSQFFVKGGIAIAPIHAVDLALSDKEATLYLSPEANMKGNMTYVPLAAGMSWVDGSLDASLGCGFGAMKLVEDGTETDLAIIAPFFGLDMYFLGKGAFRLGAGTHVRYSSVKLDKSFNGDFDGTPGLEPYSTESRWAGLGYKVQANGKYYFNAEKNAIQLGAGYFLDNRKLRTLSVNGSDTGINKTSISDVFAVEGLEITGSFMFFF